MINALGFIKNIHFVGIGGIGMSGIAEVLHGMGYTVSGSDIANSATVERLQQKGIAVHIGHRAENLGNADVVVYTSAASSDNPEILKAQDEFIPVIQRGEMLAELMRMKYGVAVAGSHGKTTTTSMISHILIAADFDPTVIIGGRLNSTNNNAYFGKNSIMVAEADESDRSFVMLYPSLAVITNIDYEHMESYTDMADVKQCFVEFANSVPFYGCNIVCSDDDGVADIIPHLKRRFTTYGINAQADIQALNIKKDGFSVSYDVYKFGELLGRIKVNLPGDHTILNSLAAVAACLELQVPFDVISAELAKFEGVQRRMSIRYRDDSTMVIDDYGHHPTEIVNTLHALREALPGYKICAVFQPHRYSRTFLLLSEFSKAFFNADYLYVTDIYAASESNTYNISAADLVKQVKLRGFKKAHYMSDRSDILASLDKLSLDKLAIVTLGAGNITTFSHELAEYVKNRKGDI